MKRLLSGIVMVLMVSAGLTQASTIVVETWDTVGGEAGWTHSSYFGSPGTSLSNPDTVAGEGVLGITGGDTSASESLIYTTDGSMTGNYNGVGSVRFDFYADAAAPSRLELYFLSGSGFSWFYQVNVNSGWNSYAINMIAGGSGGWYSPGGHTSAEFSSDLSDFGGVTEVGVLLAYTTAGAGQQYALDNFELNSEFLVPEPSTYAAIAMALLSLGLIFRQKVRETMDRAVEAIKS